jgi:hypothetical protein
MTKIMESKDYGMFGMMPFNRDVKRTKYLESSMKRHGWIDAYPMHVVQEGSRKFKIKAGHHRFVVAKKLEIPVKFVVCDDDTTIYELEKASLRWSMQDYLDSHCRNEKPEYLRVKEYCEESGISLQLAISMLGGHSAGSGNFQYEFKDGKYKIKEGSDHADIVKNLVLYIKKHGITFYNQSLLVQAISKTVWVKGFDIAQFKNKIKQFHGIIEKKANLDQYLNMLEELYNRQSRAKVPLKFLATEEAKRRNAVGLGKK